MRIGVSVAGVGDDDVAFVVEAEAMGVDSVWVAEAWGHDALTPLAFLAARTSRIRLATGIAQLGSRSPALLAMSAMSLQAMSGGRFVLGLGTSGPQVMEGWHGVRFSSPLGMTRETIEVLRTVTAGEKLEHEGTVYPLPLPDSAGRALRSMAPPTTVPVYLAALGPKNLELTGELADGWLANAFMPETADSFLQPLAAGAARAGRSVADLDVVVPVGVEFTDDEEAAARRHARGYAFTIGAMGNRDQNFYNAAFTRQGWGEDVRAVQDLWLGGDREAAAARVPLELGRRTNLLGPPDVVRERLAAYRAAGVTTLQAKLTGPLEERLTTLGTLLELCAEPAAAGSGSR
ncbi:LLM class F420-dependent oxidoreductase [Modestobacter sp. I12A-02628]|uniref:LLM class F420-dependent oxidoreductase n=1 Tax=Goekera deserti TaxID=2497753 RepID=A0A7K3WI03_9ACTN|nr:LLM class F420-dependent oxidoreductase [Goekera deserti]NDI47073.1 LLM class F420-dependent oxidoreductase [Goekera deserti]NEL55529.1 LLM class F420-dependent oxidoreductase [Goekera deserti]